MNFNTLIRTSVLAVACTLAGAASAAVITMDFEGLKNLEAINGFYNGGTGSLGSSGVNYGIQFGSNTLAVIDTDVGGSGNIANEPSPSTVMFFLTGSAVLNYAPGFSDGFSFYYSTVNASASVTVWDDLNATGNPIGTINLAALGTDASCGDPTGQFCRWSIGSLGFAGVAKSVDFGGTVNQVAYDNITFGSTDPSQPDPNPTPEPGSLVLVGAALASLAALRRRRT